MNIAILIPCYNEEPTIAQVIHDFKKELPDAKIFVYDNNSLDKTSEIAVTCGATVKREYKQGKGNVIRSMFREINADIYIMVDGDNTYPAEFVHELIHPVVTGQADMVIGDRHSNGSYSNENKRKFHNLGNNLVRRLINSLFKAKLNDIMTGYRAFNKRFVKNTPILSEGFEIETEMTMFALDKKFKVIEIPIAYRDRPEGSFSKLNTISDGYKVIKTIFSLFKNYKPLVFFSFMSCVLAILGVLIGIPVILEWLYTGYITRIPSAILASGIELLAAIMFTSGLILDTIVRINRENYELQLNRRLD